MNSFPQNSAIVLVHGAWADGSCWREIILPLERQGLKVTCAPIPLTSLGDDVSALTRALERTSGPVVLAGHAYGGAVIGAIRDERVKSFVYVAALAPDEGETVAQVFYLDEPHAEAPKLAPDKHGFLWIPKTDLAAPSRTRLRPVRRKPWPPCSDQFLFGVFKRPRRRRDGRRSRPGICLRKRTA